MTTASKIGWAGFVVALLASVTASAETVNHVSKCQIVGGTGTWTAAGQFDNTGSDYATLWCPIDYTLGAPPTTVTSSGWTAGCQNIGGLNFYGESARVCAAHANGGAETCGPIKSPSSCGAGIVQLGASVPALTHGDYLFLQVSVGPYNASTNSDNTVFGYTVQ